MRTFTMDVRGLMPAEKRWALAQLAGLKLRGVNFHPELGRTGQLLVEHEEGFAEIPREALVAMRPVANYIRCADCYRFWNESDHLTRTSVVLDSEGNRCERKLICAECNTKSEAAKFRVGDVAQLQQEGKAVLPAFVVTAVESGWLKHGTAQTLPSACVLLYRASDEALKGLALADTAWIAELESEGQFVGWISGTIVWSWDGVTRDDMGERGWRETMATGKATPDSARRWLERQAREFGKRDGESALDEAAAGYGMKRLPSGRTKPTAWYCKDHKRVGAGLGCDRCSESCARCPDPLNERYDPTVVVDGKRYHQSCWNGLERMRERERAERPMVVVHAKDPYVDDRQQLRIQARHTHGLDTMGMKADEIEAVLTAKHEGAQRKAAFTADRVPEPPAAQAPPWANDDWEEGHS